MEISQGTRFNVTPMVAATPLGRFGSAGGHRFRCLFVASEHAGCDWAGHRGVEFSHSRVVCLNGEYPFSHARVQRSAICLVGLSGTNSCRPAANARSPSKGLPSRFPLIKPSRLTKVYRCGTTTSKSMRPSGEGVMIFPATSTCPTLR